MNKLKKVDEFCIIEVETAEAVVYLSFILCFSQLRQWVNTKNLIELTHDCSRRKWKIMKAEVSTIFNIVNYAEVMKKA